MSRRKGGLFSAAHYQDEDQADDKYHHKGPQVNPGTEDIADYLATGHEYQEEGENTECAKFVHNKFKVQGLDTLKWLKKAGPMVIPRAGVNAR